WGDGFPPDAGGSGGSSPRVDTPLTWTLTPKPALSTRLRSAPQPLVEKPFRSPSRAKRRVSTPSSSEWILALDKIIQATRRSRFTASSTCGHWVRSVSAGEAAVSGAAAGAAGAAGGAAWAGAAGAGATGAGWAGAAGRGGGEDWV